MKLNLGSGQRPFGEGWINVDAQSRWNPDIVADIKHLPMISDGSAEMVVLSHVIEHVWTGYLPAMISECYRILQPGGSMIVTTPDLRALCLGWLRKRIDTQIFCTQLYGAFAGSIEDTHKWLFTSETLYEQLMSSPWKQIKTFDHRPIEGADIAADWYILGMEAVK